MYSDLYIKPKRSKMLFYIPVFLIVLTAISVYFFSSGSTPTRASKKSLKSIEVVNVTSNQVGVFWEASEPDKGWILYGETENDLKNIALDERDLQSVQTTRRYHFVILKDLLPNTQYYFNIISDNEVIKNSLDKPFTVTTLSSNFATNKISPVYGKIVYENGSPAQNSFAMVQINGAYPILSLSSATGEWLNSLQFIVSKNTNAPIFIEQSTPITIQFFDDSFQSTVRSTPQNSRPIPQIIVLGNNYSFVNVKDVMGAFDDYQKRLESTLKASVNDFSFKLKFPKNNAVIPGSAPIIKGEGVPGKAVTMKINNVSSSLATTTVNTDGEFSFSLSSPLDPGKYTLLVESSDSNNRKQKIEHIFTIIKSGERVLGEQTSTPSASLTPSRNVSPTRPVSVITITVVPTSEVLATQTPTPTLLPSPTLQLTSAPSLPKEPPVSGATLVPYALGGLGIVLISIGSFLVF